MSDGCFFSLLFLYVYEDHAENRIKHIAIKLIAIFRNITVRIPVKILYIISWICSPFVFIIFSLPSKLLRCFKITHQFSSKIPFNFARGPFSLRGDLYDRFATPVEHRFSKQNIQKLFVESGFINIKITKLKNSAGWVVWGYKV